MDSEFFFIQLNKNCRLIKLHQTTRDLFDSPKKCIKQLYIHQLFDKMRVQKDHPLK